MKTKICFLLEFLLIYESSFYAVWIFHKVTTMPKLSQFGLIFTESNEHTVPMIMTNEWIIFQTQVLDWFWEETHKTMCLHLVIGFIKTCHDEKTKLCAFRCLKSDSNFGWKFTLFSKTTSLRRESFPTLFYNINSSPLLLTK